MPSPPIPLDDLDDPRLAIYRNLKATNETRHSGQFVVEGWKLAERLLTSRFPTVSVLASDRALDEVEGRIPDGVPLLVLPQSHVEALVGYNFHRGVLACGLRRPWPGLDDFIGGLPPGSDALLAVCPRLDNPENLGALIRLADVFGIDAVVAGPRCPDPLSRRVLRVSMGTALQVPVLMPDDLATALSDLRERRGFSLIATVCHGDAEPLDRFAPGGRLGVLLGSEGHGLDDDWVNLCDRRLTIPMRPGAESLNLAVAAGIVLHHLTRAALAPPNSPHGEATPLPKMGG